MKDIYDMIVIGGGPGGYTAALYAVRAGLETLVIEKLSAGGQMALTSQIDNYPGFEDGVDGFTLGEKMQAFKAKTVVIATGASPRELGIEGEKELVGRGVNYCAACDGMFYKDKVVAVVGGGNTAAADALLLSRICRKVIIIHRRDTLRATKIYHDPLMKSQNVEFRWNSACLLYTSDAADD